MKGMRIVKVRLFSKLMKEKEPQDILGEYMLGLHGKLTEGQLQKVIDKKNENEKYNEHGVIAFNYKRKVS